MLLMHAYLSSQRFFAVVLHRQTQFFFTPLNNSVSFSRISHLQVIIGIVWCACPVFSGIQVSPYSRYTFQVKDLCFDYDDGRLLAPALAFVEKLLILVGVIVSVLSYAAIFIHVASSVSKIAEKFLEAKKTFFAGNANYTASHGLVLLPAACIHLVGDRGLRGGVSAQHACPVLHLRDGVDCVECNNAICLPHL